MNINSWTKNKKNLKYSCKNIFFYFVELLNDNVGAENR